MAVESHTDPKNKNRKTYGLDVARLEFALKAHRVPRPEWLEAWHWMALIVHDLNGKA